MSDKAKRGKKYIGAEVLPETHRRFTERAHDRRMSISSLLRELIHDELDIDEGVAEEQDREREGIVGEA